MRMTLDSDQSMASATWVWVSPLAFRAARSARRTRRRATAGDSPIEPLLTDQPYDAAEPCSRRRMAASVHGGNVRGGPVPTTRRPVAAYDRRQAPVVGGQRVRSLTRSVRKCNPPARVAAKTAPDGPGAVLVVPPSQVTAVPPV